MSFITNTSAILGDDAGAARPGTLELIGHVADEHALYFLERGGDDAAALLLMHTRGAHAGRLVPVRGGDGALEPPATLEDRIAALQREVAPLRRLDRADWTLATRVVQRRALRVSAETTPIRKFILELRVHAWNVTADQDDAVVGKAHVTAYLRPRARLLDVHRVPGEQLALVRVAYLGAPGAIGHEKIAAILAPLPR